MPIAPLVGPMKSVVLPLLHCYRCIYSWTPAKSVVRMCPRCKSVRWDVPVVRLPRTRVGASGSPRSSPRNARRSECTFGRHRFSNPRVFGSVARGEAGPESDVDLLVQYGGGGFSARIDLADELEDLLSRPVDVVPDDSLKWYAEPRDPGPGSATVKGGERTDAQRLEDMQDALRRLAGLTEGMSKVQFLGDPRTQDAVAFRIMALGEAAGRISKRTRNANPKVNWRRLSGFRNEPAHEYFALPPGRLWDFVQDELPNLASKIRKVRGAPESAE